MKLLCLCLVILGGMKSSLAQNLVDPTRPNINTGANKALQPVNKPKYVLNAVFIAGDNKSAVINGKRYQQGQDVRGSKLILISQNKVVLDSQEGRKTLLMINHTIKKDINDGF